MNRAPRLGAVLAAAWLLADCSPHPVQLTLGPSHDQAWPSTKPVLDVNFADPFLLRTPGGYYAYATNSDGVNVQVAYSPDLRRWRLRGASEDASSRDAMPERPPWSLDASSGRSPDIWAPEVMKLNNSFVLYFSARHASAVRPDGNNRLCIGAAVSTAPDRDFKPLADPIICAEFPEGVIDPSPFQDAGKLYLYYKTDGNCCGIRTAIYAQELRPDGLAVVGRPVPIGEVNDKPWEGVLVEAPTMMKRRGRYYLFYSGSSYRGPAYAVGYANCKTPVGPCVDAPENPILASGPAGAPSSLIGPGHQSILQVEGRTFIAYHAWRVRPDGGQGDARTLYLNEILWRRGAPRVQR